MTATPSLADLIAPIAAEQRLDLVRVQLTGTGVKTLQVMAEDPATGQLTLGQCETLSRAVSDMLDAVDPIVEDYTLEVSSPGIDRPLTRLSDWTRWTGHDVRAKLTAPVDGRVRLHGAIAGVDGDRISITAPGATTVVVSFADIESAKLVLTNRLIAATRPLDMTGADETIELPPADNDTHEDED